MYSAGLLLFILILSFLKLSTASLPFSSDGTDDARVLVNKIRNTRSDDFLRGFPRWISYQRGGTPDSILDYSESSEAKKNTGNSAYFVVENIVVLPDEAIQKLINFIAPLEVRFSFREWLVYLRIFLVVPLYFMVIGLRGRSGVVAAIAISITPLSLWFGGSAAAMTAAVLLPLALCGLFVRIYASTHRRRLLLLFILGIYAGKYAFYAVDYPPWKWPLFLVFSTLILVTLLSEFKYKQVIMAMLFLLIPVIIFQLIRLQLSYTQYATTLDTVYPGKRRAVGGGGYGNPMSGAITWFMETDESRNKGMVNPEFAFSLNALVWIVWIAAPVLLLKKQSLDVLNGLTASLIPLGVVILWVSSTWPAVATKYNPLTFVTTDRAGQIIGIIVLLLIIIISTIKPDLTFKERMLLGSLSGFIVLLVSIPDSVYWNKYFYATRPIELVWASCFVLGVCVFLFFAIKQPLLSVVPLLIFSGLSGVKIQPLTVGLGPLVSSPLAKEIREIRKSDPDGVWAADPFWGDAMVMAQGVHMLSGQQPLGPNREAWGLLDPTNQSEEKWNRGQSYIFFLWDINQPGVVISNPNPDIIHVLTSPCNPILKLLKLKYIMSDSAQGPCLKKIFDHTWMAKPVTIYRLST